MLPERWSTCSLPHKQYVHVIYRGVIHVQVLWDSYILGNWSILLDGYIEGVCCQDVSSDLGGNMPCTVIFGSGSIPMGYACDRIILVFLLPWVSCSICPPDTVLMTWCNGPHEPDHPSTRAIDYDCIYCQSNVFMPVYHKDS